jgi:hypothetical protein
VKSLPLLVQFSRFPWRSVATTAIGATCFLLAVCLPLPASIGAEVRHGFSAWTLLILVLLYLSQRAGHAWQPAISLAAILSLFALALAGLWSNAFSEMQSLGGMIYLSDAYRYLSDALAFLDGRLLSTFSARHPLAILLDSVLLALSGRNPLAITAVLTAMNGLATFLAASQMRRWFGAMSAALFAWLSFLFYRRFAGQIDCENLGFLLGMLGFSLLLCTLPPAHNDPAKVSSSRDPIFGLFLMTLAQMVRPGALLAPLAVAIAKGWAMRRMPTLRRQVILICLSLVAAAACNSLAQIAFTQPIGRAFSNLSYTLYGISSGGNGWEQFWRDHPEAKQMTDVDAEALAYRLAWEQFRQTPGQSLHAVLGSYGEFFSLKDESAFGFISSGELFAFNGSMTAPQKVLYQVMRAVAWLLLITGAWRTRRHPLCLVLWAGMAGMVISVAVIPPRDAALMRLHAANLPFLIALAACGLCVPNKEQPAPVSILRTAAGWTGVLLLLLMLPGAWLVRGVDFAKIPLPTCNRAQRAVVIFVPFGATLHIQADFELPSTRLPWVRLSDWQTSLARFHLPEMVAPLKTLSPGTRLLNATELITATGMWVILPPEITNTGWISACGNWHPQMMKNGLGFFVVEKAGQP